MDGATPHRDVSGPHDGSRLATARTRRSPVRPVAPCRSHSVDRRGACTPCDGGRCPTRCASAASSRSTKVFEASTRPPLALCSIRAAAFTSSPSAVTSVRATVLILPMKIVAPQWRPNRIDRASGSSSDFTATSPSCARSARAVSTQARAARDSDPLVSAGKNATTPSPRCRPTMPPWSTTHSSAARTRRRPSRKYAAVEIVRHQRRGALQVGEEDGSRVPACSRETFHPLEVGEVALPRHATEHTHRRCRLADERGPAQVAVAAADSQGHHDGRHRPAQAHRGDREAVRLRIGRDQLVHDVVERGVDGGSKRVGAAFSVDEHERSQRSQRTTPELGRVQTELPPVADPQRLGRERVMPDRDRAEPTARSIDPESARVLGHVDEPPPLVDDPGRLSRRVHRGRHVGEHRVVRQRTRLVRPKSHRGRVVDQSHASPARRTISAPLIRCFRFEGEPSSVGDVDGADDLRG